MNDVLITLIPSLPLAGFAVNILFGKRLGKASGILATATLSLSFLIGIYLTVQMGFLVDRLTLVMVLVVSGVGSLIHLYSIGYMQGDSRYSRFFAYMNLFAAMMLVLVMADNYLAMFLGWEGVGLCSYLLIGFWFEKPFDKGTTGDAARKAFVVNRIGDFGFLLGLFFLWTVMGGGSGLAFSSNVLSFTEVKAAATSGVIPAATATIIALLLFLGATGKSAQIPLFVWLPDAMAGPTPVSALIHAATMVTAGVYMIARSSFLFVLSPLAMQVVMWTGALTALFAATMALQQNDIKKILAYSTISQLGYMFMAVGAGAFAMGIFHVMTHAFFKALLFLCAGAVIHALHEEQDITRMGGLKDRLPVVYWTFLAGSLALSGFPFTAGFFSKDAILDMVFIHGSPVVWAIGVFTAGLTAYYTFRMVFLAFHGSYRGSVDHPHPPAKTMSVPLVGLGALSVVGGYVHIQMFHVFTGFGDWLGTATNAPPEGHIATSTASLIALAALTAVLAGIFVAWRMFGRDGVDTEAIAAEPTGFAKVLRNKWYVDEIYDAGLISPLKWISRTLLWKTIDDGLIHGFLVQVCGGYVWKSVGFLVSFWQTGRVGTYAFGVVLGTLLLMWILT
jgi:NADH-quinone oxidoreductase subunit L